MMIENLPIEGQGLEDEEMAEKDSSHPLVFARYTESLPEPKPFLMPRGQYQSPHAILPPEKENRAIRWHDDVLVQEIENRFMLDYPEDDDENSYEIEIVDSDKDADFYLEIVDGEIFYVFETEDDISDEEEEDDDDDMSGSQLDFDYSNPHSPGHQSQALDLSALDEMFAPDLDDDEDEMKPPPAPILDDDEPIRFDSDDDVDDSEPTPSGALDTEKDDELTQPEPTAIESQPSEAPVEKMEAVVVEAEQEDEVETAAADPKPAVVDSEPTVVELDPELSQSILSEQVLSPQESASEGGTTRNDFMTPLGTPAGSCANSPRSSPKKSILKGCPPSPKTPDIASKKKKKSKKDKNKAKDSGDKKKEKSVTKTYVRADTFDGEHQVYTWEKPKWTESALKPTGRGEQLKKSGNLENPITFPKNKQVNAHLEQHDAEEIIRQIQSGEKAIPLPGFQQNQRNLKFSIAGAKIRDGGDIVKPITKATVVRPKENVNRVARPDSLKKTDVGAKVRQGVNLESSITAAPHKNFDPTNKVANQKVLKRSVVTKEKKAYEWEKPSWLQKGLRSTGKNLKKGVDVAAPITSEKSKYEWQKPDWAKPKLNSPARGLRKLQSNVESNGSRDSEFEAPDERAVQRHDSDPTTLEKQLPQDSELSKVESQLRQVDDDEEDEDSDDNQK